MNFYAILKASYYFPSKAYRVYLVGDTPTINVPNVQNALIQAWISFNTKSQCKNRQKI